MPIIKSAIKRMRQETKRRVLNRNAKDELRNRTKAFMNAVESKETAKLPELLAALHSQIDKGVKKNALHKNTAARKKARFARIAKTAGMKITGTKKTTATAAKKPAAKKAAPKKSAAKKTPAKK